MTHADKKCPLGLLERTNFIQLPQHDIFIYFLSGSLPEFRLWEWLKRRMELWNVGLRIWRMELVWTLFDGWWSGGQRCPKGSQLTCFHFQLWVCVSTLSWLIPEWSGWRILLKVGWNMSKHQLELWSTIITSLKDVFSGYSYRKAISSSEESEWATETRQRHISV